MGWSTTSDLDQFVAAAGSYLTARTAEHSQLITAAQAARRGSPELLYGWWTPPDGGGPRGAFVHDPAVPLLIAGRVPEMAAGLAVTLAKPGRAVRKVCGVDAPTDAADAFAAAWSQRAGATVRAHRTNRVYRLTAQPTQNTAGWPPPELPGPPGKFRVAMPDEQQVLADWLRTAAIESGERIPSPDDLAADLISYGGAVFWDVTQKTGRLLDAARSLALPHHRDIAQFGEPAPQTVALVTLTRPVAGSVRIAMAYTAPDRRRSGHGAALTQAVSRALLWGNGDFPGMLAYGCVDEIVMLTDKNRPDRWGGRFGYQFVGERSVLRFGPPTGSIPRVNPAGAGRPRLPTGPLPRLPRLRG